MRNLGPRSTFGVASVAPTQVMETNPSTITNTDRKEIGSIWKATTKANKPIYNVRLNLSKQKLQEILDTAEGDIVQVKLIGFDNEYNNGDSKRPIIRMFEEKK